MTGAITAGGSPVHKFDDASLHARLEQLWRREQREEWGTAMAAAVDRCERVALDLVK